jgi:hypothetical protein
MARIIVLISCVKRKRETRSKAKDLYDSTLFQAQRAYAEKFADDWYILSAKYGLLHPEAEIGPYEQTLKGAPIAEKREWSNQVFSDLVHRTAKDDLIVITAGEDYCRFLVPLIERRGNKIERPVKGLSMGFIPGRLRALTAQSVVSLPTNASAH